MTQRKRNEKREIEGEAKNAEKERQMDDAERKKREGINHFLYDKSVEAHRERTARRAEIMAAGGTHRVEEGNGLTDADIAAMFPEGGYSAKIVKPVNIMETPMTIHEAVKDTRNRVRIQVTADGVVRRAVFNNSETDRMSKRRDGLRDPESGSSRFGPGGR